MNILNRLEHSARYRRGRWLHLARYFYFRAVASAWPRRVRFAPPLLIVGSPASGKSALRGLLQLHPPLLALPNAHWVWWQAYPATYLDTSPAGWPHARLVLTAADCTPERTARLRRWLWAELRAAGGGRLVDEWPWHSFRTEFLRGIFPAARFVHVIRHGLDAAQEIEARCRAGRLWGRWPRVWNIVEAHAQTVEPYKPLADFCRTDYERGLLLWRMTVETVRAAARRHLPPEHYLEVRYERLRAEPRAVCREAAAHLGLPLDEAAWEAAVRGFNGRPRAARPPAPPTAQALAGELLRELGYL